MPTAISNEDVAADLQASLDRCQDLVSELRAKLAANGNEPVDAGDVGLTDQQS